MRARAHMLLLSAAWWRLPGCFLLMRYAGAAVDACACRSEVRRVPAAITAADKTSMRPRLVARSKPGFPLASRRSVLFDIAVINDRFSTIANFFCRTNRCSARTSRPPSRPAPTRRNSIGQRIPERSSASLHSLSL